MKRFALPLLLALGYALPAAAQTSGTARPVVTLTVGANPMPGNVPVTAAVQPYIGSTKIPTGTITFLDGSTALNAGGTALTAPGGITSQTFAAAIGMLDPGLAKVVIGEITGDFDGDGKPDLLVYGTVNASASTEIQVFLTSNAGTAPFRAAAPQTLSIPLSGNTIPVALYVNTDTKLDLLIGNMVAYGNGDGTFSNVEVLPIMATGFQQAYVVQGIDGNGQGLVAVNAPPNPIPTSGTLQYAFTLFQYNQDGSFTSVGSSPLAAPVQLSSGCCGLLNIFGLSFADLNGDGNPDVLSQSNVVPFGNDATGVNFNVMLNNGNGTFGTPKPIDTSALNTTTASAVAFGDLNGDGKTDLVIAYANSSGNNYLAAALGNGDGTFGTFSPLLLVDFLTTPILNPQVQLEDVNGDGKLDAVTGSGEVALGNGDGTFTLAVPLFVQPAQAQTLLNYPLVQMPIEANAAPSLVYLNPMSGANAVFTPQNAATVQATLPLAAGTHTITAQYSGDSTYATASALENISVASTPPTIGITSSASTIYATKPVTFTATLSDPTATGTVTYLDTYPGSDPLQPMLNPSPTMLGTAAITNGTATYTTSQLPAGIHTITAIYGNVYAPIAQAQLTQTVSMPFAVQGGSHVISVTTSPGQSGTVTLTVQGQGGFSGPVNFSCTDNQPVCSFSPATVNLSGSGTSTVILTVTAVSSSTATAVIPLQRSVLLACGVPLLALLGFARGRCRRVFLLFLALAMCVMPFSGCGGGSASTTTNGLKAGSYPFYVTAISGQNEIAINALLTVH